MNFFDTLSPKVRGGIDGRFDKNVEMRGVDECWPWIGKNVGRGYGVLKIGNDGITANRLAWMFWNQMDIPSGGFICHKCHNRICVNPRHLYLGTPKSNAEDREASGKANHAKGENLSSKLTDAQARVVKQMAANRDLQQKEIADLFGIKTRTVKAIHSGQNWGHLDEVPVRRANSKLSESDVIAIRSTALSGEKAGDIAKRYGVKRTTINDIVTRRNWKHV